MTGLLTTSLSAQEVTLPLERYEELRELAHPESEPEPKPSLAVAFEAASLDVEIGVSSARITQELTLDLYGNDWTTVALPNLGTYIESDFAGLEGRIANGQLEIRGQGRHVARLVSVIAVTPDETATRPIRSLRLQAPRAAMVRGRLRLDAATEEVVTDGPVLVTAADGESRSWVAEPGGSFGFVLYGAAVVPERSRLPLRFDAVSASVLEVSRDRRELETQLSVRVLQGQLESLRVPVPEGFEVARVTGPIAGWDMEPGQEGEAASRELVIQPLAPVTDRLAVKVSFSGQNSSAQNSAASRDRATDAAFELRGVAPRVEGAANLLLATKVQVDGDGFLNLLDPGQARQPDGRQKQRLPPAFRDVPGLALVVPREGHEPLWQVVWPESTEVLASQVDRLRVDAVVGTSGRAAYQLWLEARSSGAAQLLLSLPGAELIAGSRDGARLVPGQSGEGWVIPLSTTTDKQVIHLSLLLPLDLATVGRDAKWRLPIPAFSAPVARVEARLHLPGKGRYRLADANRAGRTQPAAGGTSPRSESALVRQLSMASGAMALAVVGPPAKAFEAPRGYVTLEAVWNALSPAPAPLEILVKSSSTRKEWF